MIAISRSRCLRLAIWRKKVGAVIGRDFLIDYRIMQIADQSGQKRIVIAKINYHQRSRWEKNVNNQDIRLHIRKTPHKMIVFK